jgi:hypothetical protein
MRQEQLFSKRPSLNQLKELAAEVNSEPIPNIPDNPHILLPPPEYSLTKNIFQVYDEELNPVNLTQKDKINTDLRGKTHTALGVRRKQRDFSDKYNITQIEGEDLNDNDENEKGQDYKLTSRKRFRSEKDAGHLGNIGLKDDNNDLFNEDDMEVESMKDANREDNESEGEEEEQQSSQVYNEDKGNDFNINFEGFYNFK